MIYILKQNAISNYKTLRIFFIFFRFIYFFFQTKIWIFSDTKKSTLLIHIFQFYLGLFLNAISTFMGYLMSKKSV